jgi:formamidopyrimidine-DNA glycosylase
MSVECMGIPENTGDKRKIATILSRPEAVNLFRDAARPATCRTSAPNAEQGGYQVPELPEVETTLRGIAPHVEGRRVAAVVSRVPKLRLPVPERLASLLAGQTVRHLRRRGKYLLLECDGGTLILHLGMTGHLRVVPSSAAPGPYDHLDIALDNGTCLRFTDPRKFGTVLWTAGDPLQHPLLAELGPEPLGPAFSGAYLMTMAGRRTVAVKPFIMDNRIVVGVGNMYASEALFLARIHPARPAGALTADEWDRLADAIRRTLTGAIAAGGETLADFTVAERVRPYFRVAFRVYGREGEPCVACGEPIGRVVLGQRSTYFCPACQRPVIALPD